MLASWVFLSGLPIELDKVMLAVLLAPLIIFGLFVPGFLENVGLNVMADCGPELCFELNLLGVLAVVVIFVGSLVLVYCAVWYFISRSSKNL